MNGLVDTLLDSSLRRVPWQADADKIIQAHYAGKFTIFVSAITVTTSFYIARKAMKSYDYAKKMVDKFLVDFEVCPVDLPMLQHAGQLPGRDFEDNVQIATAMAMKLDCLVTRDATGFLNCPLPVYSPAQLLAKLNIP